MKSVSTREQATAVSEKLPSILAGKTFFNGFGVIEDRDTKGSFVAVVYLSQRKIPRDSIPRVLNGVRIVPMYLGGDTPQHAKTS